MMHAHPQHDKQRQQPSTVPGQVITHTPTSDIAPFDPPSGVDDPSPRPESACVTHTQEFTRFRAPLSYDSSESKSGSASLLDVGELLDDGFGKSN